MSFLQRFKPEFWDYHDVASGPYKEVLASQDPALMAVLRDLT